MLRRLLSRAAQEEPATAPAESAGQLDNADLEALLSGIVEKWGAERKRLVVEVGTGGGQGSTVALHRVLTASNSPFQLIGYEGNSELAGNASRHWNDTPEVRVEDLNFDQPDGALPLLVEWAQERPTLVVIEPPQGKSRRPDPALFAGLEGVLVARTFKPDGSLCDEIYRLCGGARCRNVSGLPYSGTFLARGGAGSGGASGRAAARLTASTAPICWTTRSTARSQSSRRSIHCRVANS